MENPNRNKKCPACSKKYVNLNAFKKHIRKKHPNCTEATIILSQDAFRIPSFQAPVVAPNPPKKRICKRCPHLPEFPSKSARKQHIALVHTIKAWLTFCNFSTASVTQCPICAATLPKQPLTKHLRAVHGISGGVNQVTNQTGPRLPSNTTPAESSHITYLSQAFGKAGGPTNELPQGNKSSVALNIHDLPLGRFYCEEYDCGRGFSSEAHLNSHTMFFHPKKPTQPAERVKEATVPSNDISDGDERSTSYSPAYFSPTSNASPPHLGELAMEDSSGHSEIYSPVLRQEGDRGVEPDAENDAWDKLGGLLEPSTGINVAQAVTTPKPLSLQCRMCGAPPTANTRPTATICGHLFCSECIAQHVMSTSRCPVCDNALLLHCLFKLDLPVLS